MVTTSLDSCTLVDIVNGRSIALRERFLAERLDGRLFVISTIALHEFAIGMQISTSPARQAEAFRALFGELPIEPFNEEDALEAAKIRAELMRMGKKLDGLDVLIGGQARGRGWTVATGNLRHFDRMPNLSVEDWSA